MNEHIKLLAEHARSLGNDEASYLERVHNRTYTIDEVNEIHYQKFAELIIRDSVDHAFNSGDNIAYLYKHFGVEESPPRLETMLAINPHTRTPGVLTNTSEGIETNRNLFGKPFNPFQSGKEPK
jgi:hypothetical protein